MCVLMLLVVNVSGKKYIVETEDDLDFSTEKDGRISRGLRILESKEKNPIFYPDYSWKQEYEDSLFEGVLKRKIPAIWIKKRNIHKKRCLVKKDRNLHPNYCKNMRYVQWYNVFFHIQISFL